MAKRRKNYQDNCQKIAFWRKFRGFLKRSYKLSIIGFLIIFTMFTAWLYKDDESKSVSGYIMQQAYEAMGNLGFKLELVKFEGDKYIGQAQLIEELGLLDGIPILAIDLKELRKEIKTRNWVKNAEVKRILPSKLEINITERKPLAIWQYKKELFLIDEDGIVLMGLDAAEGLPFPLIVGEGANNHASYIFELLEEEKAIYSRVHAAIRLSDRRWNIMFMNGIEIMMPEDDLEEAWKKLARLQLEKQVLDREVKSIDLRMNDRVYIKMQNGEGLLNASAKGLI